MPDLAAIAPPRRPGNGGRYAVKDPPPGGCSTPGEQEHFFLPQPPWSVEDVTPRVDHLVGDALARNRVIHIEHPPDLDGSLGIALGRFPVLACSFDRVDPQPSVDVTVSPGDTNGTGSSSGPADPVS